MYDSTYDPYISSTADNSADPIVVLLTFAVIAVIALVAYVVQAIFLGMIFKKAGIENWKAWVPVYNNWVLLEMGDQPGWWALLGLIPGISIVTLVFLYIAMYHVGLKFGKDGTFVLLAIFLPLVWYIWLAVDKSVWKSSKDSTLPDSNGPPISPSPPSQPAAM